MPAIPNCYTFLKTGNTTYNTSYESPAERKKILDSRNKLYQKYHDKALQVDPADLQIIKEKEVQVDTHVMNKTLQVKRQIVNFYIPTNY